MGYITIYKSSAGSGKTTVLSKEYISLALKEDFRNILAVTFTNKATQELKSRIISRLYDYSCGKDDFQSDSLKSETGLNDRQFKERCKYVLNNILYNYGQFSVSTIDSFFQRIIRSFARESGIQGNYRLELDSDTVLTEAIDRLIEEAGLHKELTDWLVRFALEVADEGKNTNLSRQIKQLGEELFSESFKEIKGVLAKESSYEAMGKFQNRLREEIKEYTEKLRYFGEKALSALKKEGLEPSDLSRGIGTALLQLCAGEDPDLSKANLSKAMNDINSWGAKSSKVKNQIDRAAESGLMDSFLEYKEYFTINNSAYSTAKAILNNFNNYGLLSEILHKINEYKSENDIMLISDSNEFLKEITGGYESPFIYEKTGNRYDHFLIDEFQDTSAFQWANFYPLIENSVSQGYKNFIVGDVKQSIYRWRGGDLNLLNSGVELQFADVINEPLITNYRSGYHIIEFNNHCFSSILPRVKETRLDTLMDSVEEDLKNKIELQFESAYLDIRQEKPKSLNNTSGYVELNYCGGKTKSDYESSAMERLVSVVEKVQEKGVEAKDIAVLVRKRSEGEAVAKYLLKYSKSEKAKEHVVYDIVSGDSLLLKNSKAVLFIVSVLRWIKAPDDKISFAAFASEFDGNSEVDKYNHLVFSKINEWISEFKINKGTNRFIEFFQGRTTTTLIDLVDHIINYFGLSDWKDEWPYILAFQDTVINFSKSESGEISLFLNWWDDKAEKLKLNSSEETNAINIVTIHKSKGLEFRVVILPYCNWDMEVHPSNAPIIWASSEGSSYNEFSYFPVKYRKELLNTSFGKEYVVEKVNQVLDNLNLLYVAFTRAEEGLYLMLPEEAGKGNVAEYIMEAYPKEDSAQLSFGEEIYSFRKKEEQGEAAALFEYNTSNWKKRLKLSHREIMKINRPLFEKIEKGEVLHEILAEANFVSNIDSILEKYLKSGEINEEDKFQISELKEQFKLHPILNELYCGGTFKEYSETSLSTPDGVLKRPDKVFEGNDKIVVLEFKSGETLSNHKNQVKEYLKILVGLENKKVEGYIVYLQPFQFITV